MAANPSKLESVQALRGFAALYVFLFHAKIPLPLWSDQSSNALLDVVHRGFMGVDVFFVISGFILAWSGVLSGKPNGGPVAFGIKRVFRVAPPYWIATFLALYIFAQGNTPDDLVRSLAFLPLSGEQPPFYGYAVHTVGWTLNYEMFFYAVFCGALFFRRYALVIVISVLVGAVFLTPLFVGGDLSFAADRVLQLPRNYLRLASNPLVLEFAVGIACAMLFKTLRGKLPNAATAALLVIGIALMAWRMAAHAGMHGVLPLGLPAAVLLLGAVLAEDAGLLRVPRQLVWLGEMSYSIYLIHPIIVGIGMWKMAPPAGTGSLYGKFIFEFGAILISAHYWHQWVEVPSMRFGSRLARILSSKTSEKPEEYRNIPPQAQ
ncbi:hypothetical protein RSSE_c3363 [Ralstonia solanacearum]|nr:hypothetical protein RSSE_c3363 [Ralstonia solanacearum]